MLSACQEDIDSVAEEALLQDSTLVASADTIPKDNPEAAPPDSTSAPGSEPTVQPSSGTSCSDDISRVVFLEKDGLVVVEAESALQDKSWKVKQKVADHTGLGYIVWEGNDQMQNPGEGLRTYRIRISKAGTYRVQLRTYIAKGDNSTEHNDVWLRLPDADDFYGEKKDHRVYPKGSGKTPQPKGASKDGWFKSYYNTLGEWGWKTATSDHDAHDIYAEFAQPGDYTIELSGRSSGFAVDRIVLYHASVSESDATSTTQKESMRTCD